MKSISNLNPNRGGVICIETTTPTTEQLQEADIVICQVNLVGTRCYTEVVNAFGDNKYSIALADRAGTHITMYTTWNKSAGTLTCGAQSGSVTIVNYKLIFFDK